MIFGWRKKSKSIPEKESAFLASSKPEVLAELIKTSEPGARLMILVGLTVMWPTVAAYKSVFKEQGIEFSESKFIDEIGDGILKAKSEQEKRRLYWLLLGFLVLELPSKIISESALIEVWSNLLKSIAFSEGALRHNVLWKDDEKELFLASEPHLAASVALSNYGPVSIRKNIDLRRVTMSLVSAEIPFDGIKN